MSLSYYIKAICHHLKSKNRHGTHSPHVYRLLDEYVYRKKKVDPLEYELDNLLGNRRNTGIVNRILPYLSVAKVMDFSCLEGDVDESYKGQMAIIKTVDPGLQVAELLRYVEKGGVLIWEEVYRDALLTQQWEEFTQLSQVTVSLDFFHVCFAYHRSGQRKEKFYLKYPYGY